MTLDQECGACHRRFATLDEVFSHACEAASPGTQGWRSAPSAIHGNSPLATGRRTPTPPPAPAPAPPVTPAPATDAPSDKQTALIRKLLAERAGVTDAEAVRATLNAHRAARTLTRRAATAAITGLLAIPKPTAQPKDSRP